MSTKSWEKQAEHLLNIYFLYQGRNDPLVGIAGFYITTCITSVSKKNGSHININMKDVDVGEEGRRK